MTSHYGTLAQKPYALYIHGLGSSAASGTKSSLARSLDGYEWLSPEITHNPFESLDILNEWATTFQPTLIAGTSMGGLLAMYVNCPNAIKVAVNPCIEIERVLRKIGYGKHPYLQPRENGETEYIIDEPMIRQFISFRETLTPVPGIRNIALFSTDDELSPRKTPLFWSPWATRFIGTPNSGIAVTSKPPNKSRIFYWFEAN